VAQSGTQLASIGPETNSRSLLSTSKYKRFGSPLRTADRLVIKLSNQSGTTSFPRIQTLENLASSDAFGSCKYLKIRSLLHDVEDEPFSPKLDFENRFRTGFINIRTLRIH